MSKINTLIEQGSYTVISTCDLLKKLICNLISQKNKVMKDINF